MKTLIKFYTENPSYCKCGNMRVAERTGIALSTIKRFKASQIFKNMNKNYRNA